MCRWIAYFSVEPILLEDVIKRPDHSILDQTAEHYLPKVRWPYNEPSNLSGPNALSNLDGFGIGWYPLPPAHSLLMRREYDAQKHDGLRTSFFHPETYHSLVQPAWHDGEVRRLCKGNDSPIVFGHVRAGGDRIEANCHPFSFGRFLFMHNGFVTGFSREPEKLERLISPAAMKAVRGTTDSVHIFALFPTFLDRDHTGDWARPFSCSELVSALVRVVSVLYALYRPSGGWARSAHTSWNSLNLAVTDGDSFVCLRYATPGREAPSLYWSTMAGARMDRQYRGEPDGGAGDASARSGEEHEPHVVVASEPMTRGRDEEWHLLGNGEILDTSMKELDKQWRTHEQHKAAHPYSKWTWRPRIRTVEQVRREIGDVGLRKRKRPSVPSSA